MKSWTQEAPWLGAHHLHRKVALGELAENRADLETSFPSLVSSATPEQIQEDYLEESGWKEQQPGGPGGF